MSERIHQPPLACFIDRPGTVENSITSYIYLAKIDSPGEYTRIVVNLKVVLKGKVVLKVIFSTFTLRNTEYQFNTQNIQITK